jgi:hypothetical protein
MKNKQGSICARRKKTKLLKLVTEARVPGSRLWEIVSNHTKPSVICKHKTDVEDLQTLEAAAYKPPHQEIRASTHY